MKDILPQTLKINTDTMMRLATNARQTGELAMKQPREDAMQEGMALALSTVQRCATLQKTWIDAWANWAEYAGSLEGADTVPKYAERIGNIGLRAQAQMVTQLNDLTELSENLSVSYAYWISQQVKGD